MENSQMMEYKLFLRNKIYSRQEFISILVNILSRTYDSNNISYNPIDYSIKMKIKKSYMKKNDILSNNIQYYYRSIGMALIEFIHYSNLMDLYISIYHKDRNFDKDLSLLSKLRELDTYQLSTLVNGVCIEDNYLVIYL